MFEDCIKCGFCQENCFIENAGFESLTSFISGDSLNKDVIWVCANCWLCQENCPQGINIMEGKYAWQRQLEPPEAIEIGTANIIDCGFCLPISLDLIEARIDQGLDKFDLVGQEIIAFLLD
ncbi:MAG TPA: hypothetical protein VFD02_07325 [Syntrophomonadaceae bacterium]|nr:hypothetical protein [Syntrophomonadaceae bacterium]